MLYLGGEFKIMIFYQNHDFLSSTRNCVVELINVFRCWAGGTGSTQAVVGQTAAMEVRTWLIMAAAVYTCRRLIDLSRMITGTAL